MSRGYRIVHRSNKIIYFETIIAAILLSIMLWKKIDYHWSLILVTFPVIAGLFICTFFRWTIWRYTITILFSMVYGLIAYYIGSAVDPEGITTSIVFAFIAYFTSLSMHKDHFDFIRNSDVIEYE